MKIVPRKVGHLPRVLLIMSLKWFVVATAIHQYFSKRS